MLRSIPLIVCLAAMAAAASPSARADDSVAKSYPDRPIRIIVPFPPGGPVDIEMRIIAQKMSEDWGTAVVIENRPGGNTTIGAQVVAKAAPDGYTLLAPMDTTLVMNPATGITASYDPFTAFAPITLTAKTTSILSVRTRDGPKTIKELIARGKANPGKLNYGAGIITTRLAGHLFAKEAGIDVVLIPYTGSAPTVEGLLNGSVDFIVDGVASDLPMIQAGQMRPLGKLNGRPVSQLPDLPTVAEAGDLPHLGDIASWIGLVAPAGTPPAIIDKLQKEVAHVIADPTTAERLDKAGISTFTSTPAEFDAFFHAEGKRWTQIFKASGIKFE